LPQKVQGYKQYFCQYVQSLVQMEHKLLLHSRPQTRFKRLKSRLKYSITAREFYKVDLHDLLTFVSDLICFFVYCFKPGKVNYFQTMIPVLSPNFLSITQRHTNSSSDQWARAHTLTKVWGNGNAKRIATKVHPINGPEP